ncbi:MAG: trypsin-like serine protease, partial [Bdellovibrionales bacterium]|nr:trypsin-like serine protease [Bdellovibrionales bacterium]
MNFKMVLFVLLVSISDLSHALYGAKPLTPSSSASAVVTLHLNDPDKPQYDSFCSGVLVAPNKVLTTGHCIEVMGTELYEQWNLFTFEPERIKVKIAGIKYEVSDVVIAHSYTEAVGYAGEDLAVITLKKNVTTVKPLKMVAKSSLKAGLPVSLIARSKIAASIITSVKSYAGNVIVFTDGSKAGVCEGDSGGALLVKIGNEEFLAGILSAQSEG